MGYLAGLYLNWKDLSIFFFEKFDFRPSFSPAADIFNSAVSELLSHKTFCEIAFFRYRFFKQNANFCYHFVTIVEIRRAKMKALVQFDKWRSFFI